MKKLLGISAAIFLLGTFGPSHADVSQVVQKAFRGKILITKGPLPAAGLTDAETISAYKKAGQRALSHSESEGIAEWSFQFTAFLKKPSKVTSMSVDFYTADKQKLYVANKRLLGVDAKAVIIAGALSINEDDGLVRGRNYVVKLTGQVRNKEVTFAQAKITMK